MRGDARETTAVEEKRSDVAVFVVDDQEVFRGALRAVVSHADGFAVVGEACSGEEATRALASLSPELVLMDVVMPGVDGIATAAAILSRSNAPLVVLTSADDHALSAARAELGDGVACVRKQDLGPSRLKELWEMLRGRAEREGQSSDSEDVLP